MATITKKDLARSVADAIGCKNNITLQMVDSLFEAMRETLIEGNRIDIRGCGVLEVKDTKPKPAARNPRTGEVVYVPARRKTHFKPGGMPKQALHQEPEYEEGDGECAARPAFAESQATGPAIQQVPPPGADSNSG